MFQGFRILKKAIANRLDARAARQEEADLAARAVDRDLPLGLRLNGIVSVDETDFLLGGGDLLTKHPKGNLLVKAFGRASVWDTTRLYRFYLESPDREQAMLQVACDRQDKVEEIHLFRTFDEVFPATPDDWGLWLDGASGLIGWKDFTITSEGRQFAFDRAWGEGSDYLAPVEIGEDLYSDKAGRTMDRLRQKTMLYRRAVNQALTEFLMLAAEEDADGAMVRIMSGVALEPAQLTII